MHIPLEQSSGDMLRVQDFNALDLAQPTNFKAMLKSGKLLWGTGCRLPYEDVARILAALPHHFCFIDAVRDSEPPQYAKSCLYASEAL
jgi:hypothetical protein